jgi:hypothetical protein
MFGRKARVLGLNAADLFGLNAHAVRCALDADKLAANRPAGPAGASRLGGPPRAMGPKRPGEPRPDPALARRRSRPMAADMTSEPPKMRQGTFAESGLGPQRCRPPQSGCKECPVRHRGLDAGSQDYELAGSSHWTHWPDGCARGSRRACSAPAANVRSPRTGNTPVAGSRRPASPAAPGPGRCRSRPGRAGPAGPATATSPTVFWQRPQESRSASRAGAAAGRRPGTRR